ncbi:MAG: sodium/proton-translocating pyrophosphatase, partial [Chloroflexi bacterium]|nr:sodium/proton-translocating pyrophosphatase [Chloroflexota bacterium]
VWAFVFAIAYAHDWRLAFVNAVGVGLAVAFNPLTSYFTSAKKKPVGELVDATRTGPATTILSGLALGMESSVWSLAVIVVTLAVSHLMFQGQPLEMLYAVAMVGIGMLSHTGNNVAMDSYGPISDNANGIAELSGLGKKAREILAELDAVGNTTKAITKQVAIASAVVAATALFFSYVTDVSLMQERLGVPAADQLISQGIRISTVVGIIGLLLGGALPWLFSSYSISAVSRAASQIIEEVRRQFRVPGVLEGKVSPNYGRVVALSTAAAQKELISLAVLAVATPLLVGLVFQVEALGAFLAGIIMAGQLLAVFMAIAGGAWDNAKKAVEDGLLGGKGSEAHKAGVVGDTVGDPLKDTAGPALNPMIKVVNLVSLLLAPIMVQYSAWSAGKVVAVLVLLAALIWAIRHSRRYVRLEMSQEALGKATASASK